MRGRVLVVVLVVVVGGCSDCGFDGLWLLWVGMWVSVVCMS